MTQPILRTAFRNARPVRTLQHDPAAFFHSSRATRSCLTPPPPPSPPPTLAARRTLRSPQQRTPPTARLLSTTTVRPATAVRLNPRTDDDGTPMSITISPRAAARLKQITSTPQKRNTLASNPVTPDSHLRVTVTSGGCHGFQYLMALEPGERVDPEEDTVFAAEGPAEEGGERKGKAEVVMDQPSLELLKGSTVDFVTELIGSQFKIVGNPRASSSCGCGTSFDIE